MESNFFIIACMGISKVKIFTDPSSCLQDLSVRFEETFSIDRRSQKIIFKGKLLKDNESSLKSLGVNKGDTLMVLGKVVHTQKDALLEKLEKFEKQLKEEENRVVSILTVVGESSEGKSNKTEVRESMKKLLFTNEKLMKLLECIDDMDISAPSDDVRQIRKSIVLNIQKLMEKVDKDYSYLESQVTPS